MATIEERLAQLERQQSMQTEALRLILEGRWTGEMPHAEAQVKALAPGDQDWSAVPFEEPAQ